jgi:hypothetical protein
MTASTDQILGDHLLRDDGQEDVCLALYRDSTGIDRRTGLIRSVSLPHPGDRAVHGDASFTGAYVLRVAADAAAEGCGVAVLHSHPGGRGWQAMSPSDADAERSYAHLVHEITGRPLLGMTLAGADRRWSARYWTGAWEASWAESVRVIGETLDVSWNDSLRGVPRIEDSQARTVTAWGPEVQASIARLRVLVIGAGSVGLDVALRLAASGIQHVAVMDFDTVEIVNLDRLIGANLLDALLHRSKVEVAQRLLGRTATASDRENPAYDDSICELTGHAKALDYDLIFSCVDRPWPRSVLNGMAYADLIPVIDGGLHIDSFPDGGMRNATWRSHVIRPGRPCLACNRQLELGEVALDRDGLLDDPEYIRNARRGTVPARQNVATLSVSAVGSMLAQFVSFVAAPGGMGEPGPVQYVLSTHTQTHLRPVSQPNCFFEQNVAVGDRRLVLTGRHAAACRHRDYRRAVQGRLPLRMLRLAANGLEIASSVLEALATRVRA